MDRHVCRQAVHRTLSIPSQSPLICISNAPGERSTSIEETLTKDWAGLRTDLSELGIKPTASYTTELMGNPGGGQSRGFTYSGTVQISIFWDFAKLLHLAGLSFQHRRGMVHRKEPFRRLYRQQLLGAERLHGAGRWRQ